MANIDLTLLKSSHGQLNCEIGRLVVSCHNIIAYYSHSLGTHVPLFCDFVIHIL